jgi:hypothetical protein
MQLAEIYLSYQMAQSSILDSPKLILMDLSLSSVLMSTDVGIKNIHLWGCPIGSRTLERKDGLVAYSHPLNSRLEIPTTKKYRRWTYLVRLLTENGGQPVNIEDLIQQTNISRNEWEDSLGLRARIPEEHYAQQLINVQNGHLIFPKFDFRASWFDTVRLFEDFCDRLFHRRDPEALIYQKREGQAVRQRWMSPEDLSFLTAVGLRALIETCWDRGILLLNRHKGT